MALLDPNDPTSGARILSEEEIKRRREIAEALAIQAGKSRPMTHPMQVLAQAMEGLTAGIEQRRLSQDESASNNALADRMAATYGAAGMPAATAGNAAPTVTAPTGPSVPSMVAANGAFPVSLISTESGGNWSAQNDAKGAGGVVGHFGRLQFGQARLAEAAAAGAIPQGTTPQQFMASPEMQQAAERWHFADIDSKIQANGLDKSIGQSINGVPVTLDGMRAVAHLGGTRGLQRFIETGGRYNPSDRNGTSLTDYLRRHAGGGRVRTAEADIPAAGATPAEMSTGGQGFVIPPGQPSAPQQPTGANRSAADLRADAQLYAQTNPEAARQFNAMADAAEAAQAQAQPAPAPQATYNPPISPTPQGTVPLNPSFMAEGTTQPWMGSAIDRNAEPAQVVGTTPAPSVAKVVAAMMPPPRPAGLDARADMPAPGAVQAMAQMPQAAAPIPPQMIDVSNSSDGGMRQLQVASEEQRQGQAPGAGIQNVAQALAARNAQMGGGQAQVAMPTPASPSVANVAAALPPQQAAAYTSGAGPAPSQGVQNVAASVMASQAGMNPQARMGLDLIRSGRRAEGMALLNQAMKPNEYGFQVVGDQLYRTDPRGGTVTPMGVEKPPTPSSVAPGTSLVDPRTGRVIYKNGEGYRSLTDPAERQRYGIGADDTKPYQLGPDNRVHGVGSGTTVNVDTKGASKFTEKANELQAKRYGEMIDGGDSARQMQGDIDMLEGISKGLATGRGAEAKLAIAQFAKSWGFDDIATNLTGGKLAEMEAFSSVIDRLTPQMRQGMPGAASDRDVAIFKNALPSMIKTPEGNAIVIQTLRAMNGYKMQAGDIAGQAIRGEIPQAEADKQIKALASPFAQFKEFRAAQDKPDNGAATTPPPNAAQRGAQPSGQTKSGLKWSVQ